LEQDQLLQTVLPEHVDLPFPMAALTTILKETQFHEESVNGYGPYLNEPTDLVKDIANENLSSASVAGAKVLPTQQSIVPFCIVRIKSYVKPQGNKQVPVLVDSGSTYNLTRMSFLKTLFSPHDLWNRITPSETLLGFDWRMDL
jgi:hypothetical protein